ncbi:MAG: hypothetical protein AB1751_11960 [Acidobacteriota bacterium]
MNAPFTERLAAALDAFVETVLRFLPGLLAALLVLALGLVVAAALRVVVRRLLVLARFDRACQSWGLTDVLAKADVQKPPSALAAAAVFWLLFLTFAMAGLAALEIQVVRDLVSSFFLYIPRLISAILLVLAGFLLANFLSRAVLLAAVNAAVPFPRAAALVVKLLITILAFAMALEQLQIAGNIVLAAFIITFGSVMLGLGLALGLGGKDVVRQLLERQLKDTKKPEDNTMSHL